MMLRIMKFPNDVEFYPKSENTSQIELVRSAIHFVSGSAKYWFMASNKTEEFISWEERKEELKRVFFNRDRDHNSEIRAIASRQSPCETFQIHFIELRSPFNPLTKPITEHRKFEIVFRNMRTVYRGHDVSSGIDNLVDLKKFGNRLDATFWYKYPSTTVSNSRGKSIQVNEITDAKSKSTTDTDEKQQSQTSYEEMIMPRKFADGHFRN